MADFGALPEMTALSGDEELLPGTRVRDFWAWALGDLRLNSTRGLLAQFLVARAMNDARRMDDGWGAFDVLSDTGIKIEVKSSGYLQSWVQKRHSAISFGGLISTRWDPVRGSDLLPSVAADVYVFAVQTSTDFAFYNPLNIDQWDFYVIPGVVIRERNQKSMALSVVQKLAGSSVHWASLRESIMASLESDVRG